jgi:hypothetical protein
MTDEKGMVNGRWMMNIKLPESSIAHFWPLVSSIWPIKKLVWNSATQTTASSSDA